MAKNPDVSGSPQAIEMERGMDPAPLKMSKPPGPAKYATPGVHPPPHANQVQDTGPHGGNKPMMIRSAKVRP